MPTAFSRHSRARRNRWGLGVVACYASPWVRQLAQASPSVPTSSSICCLLMMSGGDSAMMSPVVRISTPFSKQRRNASNARVVGLAGRRLELDAGDHAEIAHVDHVRQLAQRVHGVFEVGRELARAVEEILLPRIRRGSPAPPRLQPADGRSTCSRGKARSCFRARRSSSLRKCLCARPPRPSARRRW